RNIPIEQAKAMGATALFGEKYGDFVRVITFDPTYSMELCGGTHVKATGQIGLFKIVSESAVAAGVRRIEAFTSEGAENFIDAQIEQLNAIKSTLKNPKDVVVKVKSLMEENENLQKQIDVMIHEKAQHLKTELLQKIKSVNNVNIIAEEINLDNADAVKNISFEMRNQIENAFILLAFPSKEKTMLSLIISDNLVKERQWNASEIIRKISRHIEGGGGGQAFYATAGGKKPDGVSQAIKEALSVI